MDLKDVLSKLRGVKRQGDGYIALCPAHDDHNPSLSINEKDGKVLLHCFAGCEYTDILKAVGVERKRTKQSRSKKEKPKKQAEGKETGLTLKVYAEAKALSTDHLESHGLEDCKHAKRNAVRFPYFDVDGNLVATRYRLSMDGQPRFVWKTGDKPVLYGLWKIKEWIK